MAIQKDLEASLASKLTERQNLVNQEEKSEVIHIEIDRLTEEINQLTEQIQDHQKRRYKQIQKLTKASRLKKKLKKMLTTTKISLATSSLKHGQF